LLERSLRKPVREFFHHRDYDVSDEVPLFSRRIDIVAKRRSEVVSVELKLENWKEAIDQARLNLRVSDYSYVALREQSRGFSGELLSLFIQYGIGLLCINGTAYEVLRPDRSHAIQPYLRKEFLTKLREIN